MPTSISVLDGGGVSRTVATIDALVALLGGWSGARVKSAATTNATSVKATPGQVGGYFLKNRATAERFIKFYNKASAPTVGTDIPLFTVSLDAGVGANVGWTAGLEFTLGIAYAITAGVADTDTAVVAVDDVHGVILWK